MTDTLADVAAKLEARCGEVAAFNGDETFGKVWAALAHSTLNMRAAASMLRECAEREAALINGMSILEGMRCKRIEELEAREKALREALEPFAEVARLLHARGGDKRWIEAPLFYCGTVDDPQSHTLTGKAFNKALQALDRPAPPEAK